MAFLLDEEKTWVQRDFGLDRKILKGISKLGFLYPTMVQSKCLPIVLQGKDVLVRARTGSGKTYAFIIPILHKILTIKEVEVNSRPSIKAIILAPTKELCQQIETHTMALMYYCRDNITICSLCDDSASVQQYRLNSKPDIVITTPARLTNALQTSSVNLSNVNTLVIDEADLVLSFGYADDVQSILSKMPKIYQGLLFSATLSPELDKFKRVILHSPAILKLHETTQSGHLLQMYLRSTEADKFLILYVFIKLGLLQGKGLIFVNDIDKCYRLKLFLQQFFISAAVLNAELPVNSRTHIIEEFNRGVFDYLIATDALVDRGEEDDEDEDENEENVEDEAAGDVDDLETKNNEDEGEEDNEDNEDEEELDYGDDDNEEDDDDDQDIQENEDEDEEDEDDDEAAEDDNESDEKPNKKNQARLSTKKNKSKSQSFDLFGDGYGVSRGIDFKGVAFVINFDFPTTAAGYTHRIGRTARGGATGTSLSFVTIPPVLSSTALPSQRTAASVDIAERDEEILRTVQQQQPRLGYDASMAASDSNVLAAIGSTHSNYNDEVLDERCLQPSPLVFNMRELESFRYRVEDTLRAVTSAAVKELRAAEIKKEILNSAQLKSYFSENPTDLKVLRHDKAVLHPIRVKEHLQHVPDYLVPLSMRNVAAGRNNKKKKRHQKVNDGLNQEKRRKLSKSKDPLFANSSTGEASRGEAADDDETKRPSQPQPERIFTTNETAGRSTSGRQRWKEVHRKGKFDTKKKKNSPRLVGSFTRTKRYK